MEIIPLTQAPRLRVQAGQSKDRRIESRAVRSYTIGELYTVYHHIIIEGKKKQKRNISSEKTRKNNSAGRCRHGKKEKRSAGRRADRDSPQDAGRQDPSLQPKLHPYKQKSPALPGPKLARRGSVKSTVKGIILHAWKTLGWYAMGLIDIFSKWY